MSSSPIFGSWKLSSSDNFESYMVELGVNIILRKAAAGLSSTSTISDEGNGSIRIATTSTFRSSDVTFILDKEIEEKTMDGRHCKSILKWNGNNELDQVQTWENGHKKSSLKWTYEDGDKMVLYLEYNGVKAVRVHERI